MACAAMLLAEDRSDWPQRFRGTTATEAEDNALARLLLAEAGNGRPLVIISLAGGEPIGFLAIDTASGEIEYFIASRHRRRGHAREALAALLPKLARLTGKLRLTARTGRENQASIALLASQGFCFTGLDHDDHGGSLACFISPPLADVGLDDIPFDDTMMVHPTKSRKMAPIRHA